MLSNRSNTSLLQIKPRASRILSLLLLATHGGAVLLSLMLPLSTWLILLVIIVVLASLVWQWRRYVTLTVPQAIVSATLQEEGEWWVQLRCGQELTLVLKQSFVHPLLVVLNLSEGGWYHPGYSLVLLPDSLDEDSFRRLRVYLRQRAGSSPA